MSEKPNIVYIFSDQHRGDSMGFTGHPVVITPNLDMLAGQGVSFSRCSTNSPLCMPARASMMTGQHVSQHGVWNNNFAADPDNQSHVRNIRDAGYYTGLIGKTHLWRHGLIVKKDGEAPRNSHARDNEHVLNEWGFDYVHELTGPIASIRNDSYYTDYLDEKGLLEKHRKYMTDYTVEWQSGNALPWEEPASPLLPEDHLDSYTGQKAADWITEYDQDKPFYLQVLFPGPHDPFDSPQKYRDMYKSEEMPLGNMDWPEGPRPPYVDLVLAWSNLKGMTPEQKQTIRTFYYGKVTLIDEYIGRIYEALEKRGMLENTWIIYNSDHGEMLGDHMMSHKINFYEEALNIPLIFRPPGGTKSWNSEALTDHLDIAATLTEIAGAKPLRNSDSQSLLAKVMDGEEAASAQKGKEVIFSEVYGYTMVRNDRYKLVVQSKSLRAVEMYDLLEDPGELKNIVNDPKLDSVRSDLIEKHLKNISVNMNMEQYDRFMDQMSRAQKTGRGPKYAKGITWFSEDEMKQ